MIPTEALIAIPWPTSIVPPSAITNAVSIVGTRARYTIARGEPIFSTMIVQSLLQLSPTGSDAAAQIPPGFVGISIPYSRTNGVALGIKDGDHVNVIVSWAVVDIDQQFQTILPNRSTVLNPPNPDGTLSLAPSVVAVVNEGGAAGSPTGRGEVGVNTNESFYVIPSEAQRPRLVTQGIIQDALVLHVGNFGADKPTVIEPTPTAVPNATGLGAAAAHLHAAAARHHYVGRFAPGFFGAKLCQSDRREVSQRGGGNPGAALGRRYVARGHGKRDPAVHVREVQHCAAG